MKDEQAFGVEKVEIKEEFYDRRVELKGKEIDRELADQEKRFEREEASKAKPKSKEERLWEDLDEVMKNADHVMRVYTRKKLEIDKSDLPEDEKLRLRAILDQWRDDQLGRF